MDRSSTPTFDFQAYRAGIIFGALTLVLLLGAIKDFWSIIKPSGRGVLLFGFLMIRYSSVERVLFGYRFFGPEALLATFLHLVLYALGAYGLIGLRRWAWYLVFAYVLYIPLSEGIFLLLYGFGYLTNLPYPVEVIQAHFGYLLISAVLELSVLGSLWWYRDLFVQ
jgi:hypothetical protein